MRVNVLAIRSPSSLAVYLNLNVYNSLLSTLKFIVLNDKKCRLMKPTPWQPLRKQNLPYRLPLLKELQEGALSIRRGIKLSYLIHGPYGVGKSSILLSLREILQDERGVLCLYLDSPWDLLLPSDLLSAMIDSLAEGGVRLRLSLMRDVSTSLEDGKLTEAIVLLDSALKELGLIMVLLLDDVEYLLKLSRHLWMRDSPSAIVKALLEAERICPVLSGSSLRRIAALCGRSFSLLIRRSVPPLSREDTHDLLNALISPKLRVTKQAAEVVYKVSDGLPLYIHIIAVELLQAYAKGSVISAHEMRQVITDSLKRSWGLLNLAMNLYHKEVFARLGGIAIALRLLSLISKGIKDPRTLSRQIGKPYQYISVYIKRLEEEGILKIEEGEIRIASTLYGDWLRLLSERRY